MTEQNCADGMAPLASNVARERSLIQAARQEAVALAPSTAHLPSENAFPGYRLRRLIRHGAQGDVYDADDLRHGGRVALKVMRSFNDATRARARFEAEVAALKRLRHPNILPILDFGEAPGGVYFVMPLIAGRPLNPDEWRERPISERVELMIVICEAVQSAHVLGVIHRDLKPSNILIDGEGTPYVVDFGLAKFTEDSTTAGALLSLTLSGEFVGSLAWASPEQLARETSCVDVRSDVFSLGVILYQLATGGAMPFGSVENIGEWAARLLNSEPTPPRSVRPTLSRDLETIILMCLQRDPSRRHQSAGDLARDLRRVLAREPIEARRDSAWYLLNRFVARHKVATALAGATAFALLAAGAITATALVRTQRAERNAAASARQAEAINTFLLNDMLGAANPDRQGRNVRVVDVLERAEAAADSAFADDSYTRAAVHETIGKSYMSLGEYEHAGNALSSAITALAGAPDSEAAISARNQLGKLRWLQGRRSEALEELRQSYERSRRALGPEHERTLEAMTGLAVLMRLGGDLEEARALCESALAIRRRLNGPDHFETLTLMNNLAMIERQVGDMAKAVDLLAAVSESTQRALGARHPATLLARANLASVLLARGDAADAAREFSETLAAQEEILGANHPETASVRAGLAQAFMAQSQYQKAREQYEAALTVLPVTAHLDRARIWALLAEALSKLSRIEPATEALDHAQVELDQCADGVDTAAIKAIIERAGNTISN